MLKRGQMNNCEKCNSSYSTYNVKTEMKDDNEERWCELPIIENGVRKEPKGLCQFCNPKSIFYNKQNNYKLKIKHNAKSKII